MRKALVIGINNYPSAPLKGCINDAAAFGAIMETHGNGEPNFQVNLKTDVKTRSELRSLISDLFKGDPLVSLLYFSGHGFINELGGYIVTPDAKAFDEGVSMEDILKMANSSKAQNKIIILDCCHSGAFAEPTPGTGVSSYLMGGVTILTASRKDESAIEVNGHGIFTNLLLDALQGGASDIRGNITPGSVYAYIDQAMGEWDQRPMFKTNIARFIALREIPSTVPKEILRKLITYFPTPVEEFKLDSSFEETNSHEIVHSVVEPYAKTQNVDIFKHLQKFQSVGLVVPVDSEFMYFAAMNSKSCKLTALGYHYWRLVKDKRI